MPLSQSAHVRSHSINIGQNFKNSNQLAYKKRIKAQYIPKYRKKLDMQRTKTSQPSFDRLSQLTIKQIDRLVQMQKIQCLLNQQKAGIQPVHISPIKNSQNKHFNVFKGNFLAKINKIALKRNIKHLKSEQFDENALTHQERRKKGLQMQKKNLRYIKNYRIDQQHTKQPRQQCDNKSIESINESISQFQENLQKRKQRSVLQKKHILQKYRQRKTNILSATRWFDGMSTYYLNLQSNFNNNEINFHLPSTQNYHSKSSSVNDTTQNQIIYKKTGPSSFHTTHSNKIFIDMQRTSKNHGRLKTIAF